MRGLEPLMKAEFSRGAMSADERQLRSKASQVLAGAGLLHGSLVERQRRCGKPNCRCASGEGHRALILTVRSEGAAEQIYVPQHLEDLVRRWVSQDRELRELLDRLTRLHTERLRDLKTRGTRSSDGS